MNYLICMIAALSLIASGCAQTGILDSIEKSNDAAAIEESVMEKKANIGEPKLLAGTNSKYYRFDKTHYEKSLQEGKIIFLDFHASWCPICRSEHPDILAAFNELNNEEVVGYQVHYNDDETNEEDKEMAKKFGITYQHTKVFLNKNGEVALKSLEVFSKDKIINEISKLA